MAELTQKERLQPSLLDRLVDDEPELETESRDKRVLSLRQLRAAVLRDLAWLFNTSRLDSLEDLRAFPEVRCSVLNYGIPDLTGHTASSIDTKELERLLRDAVLEFEPRLLRESLRIRLQINESQMNHNAMTFDIEAQLWAQPAPLHILLRTELDLEAGEVKVSETGGGFPGALMDPRLLRYYNQELQHLREVGAEFAQEFPKVAGRLGVDGTECADPYVERLLEGFAFLAARVQLKLDAEFPRFTRHLLEAVIPHYLAPTPSMTVVQIRPDLSEGGLAEGFAIPRGSSLRSQLGPDDKTACDYRTGHAVTLWPLEIAEADYLPTAAGIGNLGLPVMNGARAAIRLRLRTTAGLDFSELALDTLSLYVRGSDQQPMQIYEQLLANAVGVVARPATRPTPWQETLPAASVRRVGFADEQALLPYGPRSFQGYRLLHEYFSFPARYMFVDVCGLAPAVRRCEGDELELVVELDRSEGALEHALDADNFALFCTTAINLFPKRADRIHINEQYSEHHVVVDRTRPLDYEVYQVSGLSGFGSGSQKEHVFQPFYACTDIDARRGSGGSYYAVRREPRVLSERQRREGPRTSYVGSEVFLSLVDTEEAPYATDLRQLAPAVLCTNRDLPLTMPVGKGETDFSMESAAPWRSVRCIAGPTPPRASWVHGETAWRLIDHLSLNYLSITDRDAEHGAEALRELLKLYTESNDRVMRRQIESVRSVTSRPVTRRMPVPGPIVFGRGLQVTVECDESGFEGTGAFLLGAVLDEFFCKYVSLNSFTETVLRSIQRGEIKRWRPRSGRRQTL